MPFLWRVKKLIWTRWHVFRYTAAKERPVKPPRPNGRTIGLVPFAHVNDKLPLQNVRVFDKLPKEEDERKLRLATALVLWLTRTFSPQIPDLPQIDADPNRALNNAFTKQHQKRFRSPERPHAFRDPSGPDLGELALKGPYSIFLERLSDGNLGWELSHLSNFEHHPDLLPIGVQVTFAETGDGGLEPISIQGEAFGTVTPADSTWLAACRLAVCAATTHLSLTRHFNYVHLVAANHWDVVTRNHLPSDHPLYRLLWPHLTNGLYTNYGITQAQLLPTGDFVNIFSFTHRGLMAYFDAMHAKYDISVTDPDTDWNRRGLIGTQLECASHQNLTELFTVMHDHALRYLMAYYASDEELAADRKVQEWVEDLDHFIPNGVNAVLGSPITRAGMARLIGSFIYEGNTIHDLAGTTLWDYQLWSDHNPVRMYANEQRPPLDVYFRLVNNNFGLQLKRAELLHDYGSLALDEKGEELFREFYDSCRSLQDKYDDEPAGLWRMEPKNLEISMNG